MSAFVWGWLGDGPGIVKLDELNVRVPLVDGRTSRNDANR